MKPVLGDLVLDKPVYGGDCLGRDAAGKAVFVPLTLPGERVAAQVEEEKRGFIRAELRRLETASPERVSPRCRHFGVCGGCHYQHANYRAQVAMKARILGESLERAGVRAPGEIAQLAAEPWGYRNRIRLALDGEGKLGYRGRRSHRILSIAECPIAAPVLLEMAGRFAEFLGRTPAPCPVTEVELFTSDAQARVLLTVFCEVAPAADAGPWLALLERALGNAAAGARLVLDDGSFDARVLAAAGETWLTYTVGGVPYRVDQGAFFQGNRWLLDDFAALVTEGAGDGLAGESAWDLYAGVGLFARRLRAGFDRVTAVESAPAAREALRHNLMGGGGEAVFATTLDFLRGNRERREPRPELIVLDPPRAGLGEEVTALLNAIHAPAMVYASCDPATLARDLRALTRERYRIDRVTLVDMFPQTFHLETVVHLSRS